MSMSKNDPQASGPDDADRAFAERVLRGLPASIRPGPTGPERWDLAEPYLLRQAIGHAIDADQVDKLLADGKLAGPAVSPGGPVGSALWPVGADYVAKLHAFLSQHGYCK